MFHRSSAHRSPSRRVLLAGLAFAALAAGLPGVRAQSAPAAAAASCDITTTSRVVAVGDVHGALQQLIAILREARLIDGRNRWIGGRAILVQTGDLVDRGPDSRLAMDLVRRLEGEAAAAGGQVHALLGNHEVMRMAGDVRYASPAEYDAFRSSEASDLRERLYAQQLAENTERARAAGVTFDAEAFRKTFLAATPLGAVEMQSAFAESGDYGSWLRQHDVMVRINGTVFVHAGPNATFAALGCEAMNSQGRADIKMMTLSDPDLRKTLLWNTGGPVWYRGLLGGAKTPAADEPAADDEVAAVLTSLSASRIVVGHTTSPTRRIRALSEGRVLQIDTGMLAGDFYTGGAPAALEIQGGTFTAIYVGAREVLIQGTSAGGGLQAAARSGGLKPAGYVRLDCSSRRASARRGLRPPATYLRAPSRFQHAAEESLQQVHMVGEHVE